MTKLQEKIVDAITGEVTMRDLTTEEIAIIEEQNARLQEAITEMQLKATQKQAVLEKLGLTADEAKLLFS